MKAGSQIESHNSFLTNREMAQLSSQIDQVALIACQTLKYGDIQAYYSSAEHYYKKISPLIYAKDLVKIESIKKSYYSLVALIEGNSNYRTKKSLDLLLKITKDFYFTVRDALQENQYYFRVHKKREKGLGSIPYDVNSAADVDTDVDEDDE